MFTSAAAVLLISDAFEFSWRYQLPALITLPPAAALALTALFTHRREGPGEPPVTAPVPGSQTDMAAHAVPRAGRQWRRPGTWPWAGAAAGP